MGVTEYFLTPLHQLPVIKLALIMPIAICYTNENIIDNLSLQQLIAEWATLIQVDTKDIHVSMVYPQLQSGQTYKLLAHVFLPTLWTYEEVNNIQLSFHRLLMKYGGLLPADIFIITTLVPSAQVVENGSLVTWSSGTSQKNNVSIL
jgi:hypothetical protein